MNRLLTLLLVVFAPLTGCGGNSATGPSATTGTSTTRASSHNAGADCLSCHSFSVAGTAYRSDGVTPYAGAVVRLTTATAGGGTVLATITADGSGNFYTSAAVNFGTGLFTTATSTDGTVSAMNAPISSGSCNRCHTSGKRITVN